MVFEKNENIQKEAGVDPFKKTDPLSYDVRSPLEYFLPKSKRKCSIWMEMKFEILFKVLNEI